MKRFKFYVIFLALIAFLSIDKINAECDNRTQLEINAASSSVLMNYNMETLVVDTDNNIHREISPDEVEYSELSEYTTIDQVTVSVENVTDKIYVVFQNEDDGIYKVYHYQDLVNGGFKYEVPSNDKIRKFKLTIFSDVSECADQELRTIEITTPKYNELASYPICENNDNYYCRTYITSEVSADLEKITKEFISKNETNDVNGEAKNNVGRKTYLIGIAIIVVLIIAIIVVIIKNKKKNYSDIGGM